MKTLDHSSRRRRAQISSRPAMKYTIHRVSNVQSTGAVNWEKGKLSAFILYGRTKVGWKVTLSHRGNYRMLYVLITNHDPKADVLEDTTAPYAISKMAKALEKHGCWTVSAHCWYLQRDSGSTDVCDYYLPPSDLSSGYEKSDKWMSGIDGSVYVPKEHLSQRLLTFSLDTSDTKENKKDFINVVIGNISNATENELHNLRQFSLAYEYQMKFKEQKVTARDILECIVSLRTKASQILQHHTGSVWLNSCKLEEVKMASDYHRIVCQHQDLHLSSANQPLHCLVLDEGQYSPIDEGALKGILAVLLSFSGVDIFKVHSMSLNELKAEHKDLEHFWEGQLSDLQEYHVQSHWNGRRSIVVNL